MPGSFSYDSRSGLVDVLARRLRLFDPGWRAFFSSRSACRSALSALVRFSDMWTVSHRPECRDRACDFKLQPGLLTAVGQTSPRSTPLLEETVGHVEDCQYHNDLNHVGNCHICLQRPIIARSGFGVSEAAGPGHDLLEFVPETPRLSYPQVALLQ